MGEPAAKQGDRVVAVDTHLVIVVGAGAAPTPMPFAGILNGGLSLDVRIMGRAAATVGSTADNLPPHVPVEPGAVFARPPTNRAIVQSASSTVRINGRFAARHGDRALTCNDPADLPAGTILAPGTVRIG